MRLSSSAFGRSIVRAIPAAAWLPSWRLTLKRDTLAALAVWAVLVPQAMAYAALAGMPPVQGLYAACAGLLLYALLGTSRQLNVGPSSGLLLPLLRIANLRRLYRIDKADFAIALVCLTGVLVWGVLGGILVAVVASLVALVYRSFRPEVAVLGRSRSSETDEDIAFRDVSRHRDVETFPGLVIFRFDQEIYFANATFFRDQIRHLVESSSPRPRTILVDAEAVTHIDTTAVDVLTELHNELSAERVSLAFARIKGPVHDILTRAGLVELLGPDSFYPTLESGVASFLADTDQRSRARASPTTSADEAPDSPFSS